MTHSSAYKKYKQPYLHWVVEEGVWSYIHWPTPLRKESADHPQNMNAFMAHILLEFLDNLDILGYDKVYDDTYEITIRRKFNGR